MVAIHVVGATVAAGPVVTPEARARIGERLDAISRAVSELRTPPSFADQLYVLRDHVAAVRRRLDVAIAS